MVFVTGGTGLIGSHLLYKLVSSGYEIKALKRKKSNLQEVLKIFSYYSREPERLFNKINWVTEDIEDYFALEKLLKGVDEVYHCAGMISFYPKDRLKMLRNNVNGTANLVNAALENEIKKFCHVSSVAALGNKSKNLLVNEETNWVSSRKNSGYSESKFFSETEIWRGIEEGLKAVIVNPSVVLGPGNWDSGSSKLFKTVWKGMKFYTRGTTGFVDVRDVANAMVLLMENENFDKCNNNRFILNSENISYKTLFSKIAVCLGKSRPIFYASDFLLGMTWRFAGLFSLVTGKTPVITRETVNSSNKVRKFDGNKIKRFINFEYIPISVSIEYTSSILRKEMQ